MVLSVHTFHTTRRVEINNFSILWNNKLTVTHKSRIVQRNSAGDEISIRHCVRFSTIIFDTFVQRCADTWNNLPTV